MKKFYFLFQMLLLPLAASADAVEIEGIYYNLDAETQTAEVTSNPSRYTGDIVVPSSVTFEEVSYSVTSIGYGAFQYCWNLTGVKLPESITSIGDYAFNNCSMMASFDMPKSVTVIGQYAFQSCRELTSIDLPVGLTNIGNSAFSSCSGLESIIIPSSVSTIGSGAFKPCANLTKIIVDKDNPVYDSRDNCNAIIQTEYNALVAVCKNTVIPEGVEELPFGIFSSSGITSVVIPESVNNISYGAFMSCPELTSVQVAEGNEKYDSRDNCNAIIETAKNMLVLAPCGEFTIPETVTGINSSAFTYSNGLTSVTIPKTVTWVHPEAFMNNANITTVEVEEGNEVYDSRDHCNAVIETASNTLVAGCSASVIPNTVTAIGPWAFYYCTGLASINIPEGVQVIEESAFKNCQNLTSAYFPSTLQEIKSGAFHYCRSLTDIYCHATTPPAINEDATRTFSPEIITLHVLTGAVDTYKSDEAWSQFKEIVGMTVSDNNIVFEDATVKSLCVKNWDTGGDGELSMEEAAAVTSFGSVFYNKRIKTFNEMQYFTGVEVIGSMAFHFSGVTSIKFPTSVTEIGTGAFDETGLISIDGGVTMYDFVIPDHITTLRWEAFACNWGIHSVRIPASVTVMEPLAFRTCDNLNSFTIDEDNPVYKMVDGWVIENGTTLLSSPVQQELEKLVVPEGITEIAKYATAESAIIGLKEVVLPASLHKIGNMAFGRLEKVICNGKEPAELEIEGNEDRRRYPFFQETFDEATLYVPAGSKADYEAAEGWKNFKHIEESVVEEDVIYTFNPDQRSVTVQGSSDENEKEVEIQAEIEINGEKYEVTAIGDGAFENNKILEKVSIPETVESIGDDAFAGCTNLKQIRVFATEPIQLGSAAAGTRGSGASSVFAEVDMETCVLYVPAGSKEKYEEADGWKDFKNIVEMGESVAITIGGKGKATYTGTKSLDFSFSDKVKAYVATGVDKESGTIWLTRVKDVPAGVPVMIKGEANKTYNVPVKESKDSYYENMFVGNTSGATITINETSDDGTMTNYYMSDGQFKSVKTSAKIGDGKCYLQLPTTLPASVTGDNQPVKIAGTGKSSYAAPVDLDFTNVEGLKAFTATGYDRSSKTIWLTRVMKAQKGEGLLLKGDANQTYNIPSSGVQSGYGNMFVGNTSGDPITIYETADDGSLTNFYLTGGQFKSVTNYATINNNRCYLQLPTEMVSAVASTRGVESGFNVEEPEVISMPIVIKSLTDADGTTGIDEVIKYECQADDAFYNLQGQRVDNPGKGLYIKNGRKVIIR